MRFVNHTKAGSLDSGDALECISEGIQTATLLLRALDAGKRGRPRSRAAFGTQAQRLKSWRQGARALLDACNDEEVETCDECENEIPVIEGGSLTNKHHATSCSLFDADKE